MSIHPVAFVGAGPGAEDLITLRGLHALEEADSVPTPDCSSIPACSTAASPAAVAATARP